MPTQPEFVDFVLSYGASALSAARLSAATAAAGGKFASTDSLEELRNAVSETPPRLVFIDAEATDHRLAIASIEQVPKAELVLMVGELSNAPASCAYVEKPLTHEVIAMLLARITRAAPKSTERRGVIAERYRLIRELGKGHGGRVFLAADSSLEDRQVALKLLPIPETEPNATRLRQRCRREASSLAVANHPVIVDLYDSGEWQNNFFLAAEFIEGLTIDELVRTEGPLSDDLLLRAAADLASALVHLEDLNIVHRDLKPGNVMLATNGRIRLVDFGLARAARDLSRDTASGDLRGTPHVMPPEAITEDGEVDSRGDVYSLGVTLFFMSTGEFPFQGSRVMDILSAHVYTEPPALTTIGPPRPEPLEALVNDMLAKKAAARPRPRQALARAMAIREAFTPKS